MKITNPAIKYFGGKWTNSDWILSFFPKHESYVEPFGGGASILIRKPIAKTEIYNDLNSYLVNFFRVLREKPEELLNLIDLTPYSREEFNSCKDWDIDNEVELARRFFVCSWQGFSFAGREKENNTWSKCYSSDSYDKAKSRLSNKTDNLFAIAQRIKKVQIENIDALKLIKNCDSPSTLFYVDPPYELSTRKEKRYAYDSSDLFQEELSKILNGCCGMVILSGYRCESYDEWFKDWQRFDKQSMTQAVSSKTENGKKTESIWVNKNISITQPSLF